MLSLLVSSGISYIPVVGICTVELKTASIDISVLVIRPNTKAPNAAVNVCIPEDGAYIHN